MQILCSESSLWTAPNWSKIKKWQWHHNFLTWRQRQLFLTLFFFVKFSCWSKFHVNIITGSAIMTISFYKGLTRNPEIRNTPIWALPNIWRLGWVMDAKFGTNVSNRILLKAAKFQGYSFYYFWVIKGKPTGGGVKLAPPHTQIRVNWNENFDYFFTWSLFLADQWRWIGKIDSCVLVK